LRGMFAVAIWDTRQQRLVLTRDRYGIKPLYYRDTGDELRFASELRVLPRGEIDLDALEAFLAFNSIPAPYSIFRDVRKLPAGHVLIWQKGAVTLERYARPGPAAADARRVAERYGTNHHELLVRPDPELLLQALADAFDEPFADSSALPTYLVSQLAAEHVKVALSGEGGDELFGGYYTYAADLFADR